MINIATINPLADSISVPFKSNLGNLGGRAISFFGSIPAFLQNNTTKALATIFIINALFFSVSSYFVKFLNNSINSIAESQKKVFSDNEIMIKNILINGFALGGMNYCLNSLVSKLYPMSTLFKLSLTVTVVGGRFLFDKYTEIQKAKKDSLTSEKKNEPTSIPIEEPTIESKKAPASASVTKDEFEEKIEKISDLIVEAKE